MTGANIYFDDELLRGKAAKPTTTAAATRTATKTRTPTPPPPPPPPPPPRPLPPTPPPPTTATATNSHLCSLLFADTPPSVILWGWGRATAPTEASNFCFQPDRFCPGSSPTPYENMDGNMAPNSEEWEGQRSMCGHEFFRWQPTLPVRTFVTLSCQDRG